MEEADTARITEHAAVADASLWSQTLTGPQPVPAESAAVVATDGNLTATSGKHSQQALTLFQRVSEALHPHFKSSVHSDERGTFFMLHIPSSHAHDVPGRLSHHPGLSALCSQCSQPAPSS